jgi:hypothetical protein
VISNSINKYIFKYEHYTKKQATNITNPFSVIKPLSTNIKSIIVLGC